MRQRKRTNSGDLQFNPKRILRQWTGSTEDQQFASHLAGNVSYTGNPAHKRSPGDFGLTPPAAARAHATLCDDAGVLCKGEARKLLKEGVKLGLVDDRIRGEFPQIIWALNSKGIVFEAQLENADQGQYHGYPMAMNDPLRAEIVREARRREQMARLRS